MLRLRTGLSGLVALFLWSVSLMSLASSAVSTAPQRDELAALKNDLEKIRQETAVPAIGIALVDAGGVVWTAGIGQARRAPDRAADENTVFRMGSVSKILAGLAVMKLVEQKRLDLHAPVRSLAPEIQFENRWEATHPVRVVHLLEHTTGWEDLHPSEAAFAADDRQSLQSALAYRPQTRHSRWMPGTRSAYSSVGTVVAAYLVEKASGMPYEQFVQQTFLTPLGMQHSGFFDDAHYRQQAAQLYALGDAQHPVPYWHMLDRPAGAFNSSPADMAKLLQMLLGSGASGQVRLLSAESIARMQTPHTTLGAEQGLRVGYGLGHESSGHSDSRRLFHGHDGAVIGGISRLVYEPGLQRGYVLMQNNDDFDAFFRLSRRLHQHLLQGVAAPAATSAPAAALPARFNAVKGWYRHVTPRRELTRFTEDLTELSRFEAEPGGLRQRFLMGGEQRFVAHDANLLADARLGIPMLARVQDPLAGEALQIGANLFQPVSALTVYALLGLLLGWAGLLPVQVLTLVAGAVARRRGQSATQFWPGVCLLLAAVFLLLALLAGPVLGGSDFDFGRFGPTSASVFFGSLGFAGLTVLGGLGLLRAWRTLGQARPLARLTGLFALLQIGVLVYLGCYGMLGVRTWV